MDISRGDNKIPYLDKKRHTWIYSSVKTHQTVHLALGNFTIFKLYLVRNLKWKVSISNEEAHTVFIMHMLQDT